MSPHRELAYRHYRQRALSTPEIAEICSPNRPSNFVKQGSLRSDWNAGSPLRMIFLYAVRGRVPHLVGSALLSIPLSIDPDIIRHREGRTTADHAVRQRFTDFLPDFLLPFGRLISVRSEVQLLAGPYSCAVNHSRAFRRLRFLALLSVATGSSRSRRIAEDVVTRSDLDDDGVADLRC